MSSPCAMKAFDGCSCTTQCKSTAVYLGRFQTTRDMRGVFMPSVRIGLAFVAMFVATAVIMIGVNKLLEMEAKQVIADRR